MKNLFRILPFLFIIFACNDDNTNNRVPTEYTINGKVAKGPFISGSKVTLQPMDENLNLLGSYYTCNIIDNEGNYSFGSLKLESPYAILTAEGYYFNEVKGELSNGPITLTALVDLNENTTINLNVLTHLKKDKTKELMLSDKISFEEASYQSQKEILSAFGLQRFSEKDATTFSIIGGDSEAAALIVISSTLLYEKSDAEFTLFLSNLCNEFKEGLSPVTQKLLSDQSRELNLINIEENIIDYYTSLGTTITIKDLSYYVDWDGDGIAGNEFGNEGEEKILKFEQDTIWIPSEGGKITIKLNTNLNSISLTNPKPTVTPQPTQTPPIFKADPITFSSSIISDKNIEISVEEAKCALMYSDELTVYSLDGGISSTVKLIQSGNKDKEVAFTEEGKQHISLFAEIRGTINLVNRIDALYTHSINPENEAERAIYENNLINFNPIITSAHISGYFSIRGWERVYQLSEILYNDLHIAINIQKAISYYKMSILWNNIPFIKSANYTDEQSEIIERLDTKQIFKEIEPIFAQSLKILSPNKTNSNTLSGRLFPSKDVSKGLLARIHMHLNEYDKALIYLEEIIGSNNYKLDKSLSIALGKNTNELIYGFPPSNEQEFEENNYYIPELIYTEIILSAAECEYKRGNLEKANLFLNMVIEAKGITEVTESDFLNKLTIIWQQELKGTGSYLEFLKRNGIACEVLNITPEQLIFPPFTI